MAQEQQKSAIRALQDAKKLRRVIRMRKEDDPAEVAKILDKILREALVARQALGGSRLGKNAAREIKNVRNDLIAGRINIGDRRQEYIIKFSTVYDELTSIDREQAKVSRSEIAQEAKQTVSSFLPRKEMLISAAIAANPILGYGIKLGDSVGSALFGGGKKQRTSVGADKIESLQKQYLGDNEQDTTEQVSQAVQDFGESSPQVTILAEKLDLIHEELRKLNPNIERVSNLTEDSSDYLQGIEREARQTNKLERIQSSRSKFGALESQFEAYGSGSEGTEYDVQNDNVMGTVLANLVGGSLSSGESSNGDISAVDIAAGTAGGMTAKSVLGAVVKSAPFILGIKAALVGAVVYAGWKYKDNIWEGLVEAFSTGSDPIDRQGLRPGPSREEMRTEEEFRDAAKADPATVAARDAVESTKQFRDDYVDELDQLKHDWDKLVDQSQKEMDENGDVSAKTREAMLENNQRQKELKEEIKNLADRIRELNRAAASIQAKRTGHYRRNPDEMPVTRTSSTSPVQQSNGQYSPGVRGVLDMIGEKESRGNYNALVGSKRGYSNPSELDLSNMTIGEIQEYQAGMRGRGHLSDAVGKYQFIGTTLKEQVQRTEGVDMDTKFTPEVQDKLATGYLDHRGMGEYMENPTEQNARDFAVQVAAAWASMPMPSGRSYHDKNGVDKALIDYATYLQTIKGITREPEQVTSVHNSPQVEMETSGNSSMNVSTVSNNTLDRESFGPGPRGNQSEGSSSPTIINNNNVSNNSSQGTRTMTSPESNDPTWRSLTRWFDFNSW